MMGIDRRPLYPEITPYDSGMLAVGDGHEIYYEQCGNPQGKPGVYIHGGPGAGCNPGQRRVFDPDQYRIILFDQRGCGKSQPKARIDNNTTWDLVADMEKLRRHLGIRTWLVCGGSWGSTLSLAYAETHPGSVSELILRGIFTVRECELEWYYGGGAANIFPDEWERFLAPLATHRRGDTIAEYYRLLTSEDVSIQQTAAKAWSIWEGSTINLLPRPMQVDRYADLDFAVAFARIECHYFVNKGFFPTDGWLINNIEKIQHIPTTIIQGRYDVCTPMITAWHLHRVFPEAVFEVVDDAGHAFDEPGIADALVRATLQYADQ